MHELSRQVSGIQRSAGGLVCALSRYFKPAVLPTRARRARVDTEDHAAKNRALIELFTTVVLCREI
jgi:hypothetical protein